MRFSHPHFQRLHEQLDVAPSRGERLKIIQQARKSAREEFPFQLDKLDKLLLNYNPFFILGTFSFCYLTYLPEEGRAINDSSPILIGQPHVELVQALILCHYEQEFRCNPTRHTFETRAGTPNVVDSTNIKQFICLSITLERFGPLAAQIPKLQSSGLAKQNIPVVPAMSLADLEIILEFLDNPFQLVHYLTRRTAFELKHEFVGDELDLMVFYLRTGFAKKAIPDSKTLLFLAPLSQTLDRFFLNAPENPVFEKPKRALSKWWIDILAELEKKGTHRRYEIGCILLDMPDEEQQVFEKRFEERCAMVRKINPFTLESVEAMWTPVKSEVSNAVLIAAPVREQVVPQRYFIVEQLVKQAIAETGADQALVILVDADRGPWPYSGMYLLDKR